MSNLTELIKQQKEPFMKLDKANGNLLAWEQECLFARQQIIKNQFTIDTCEKNPVSLQNAILNVAAIGISLNPAEAHAYLVPRDGQICLDISYKGLVKLATDCGAIKDCKSVLVYESDTFKWYGPYKSPEHEADVFSTDRGEVVGAYNEAYLSDGRIMVEVMSRADLDKIQKTSKAQNGPWKTWKDQMQLKSVTKRAYKSWPQTENRIRLDKAVEVLNEHEGLAYSIEEQIAFEKVIQKGDPIAYLEFQSDCDPTKLQALRSSFQYGEKTKLNQKCDDLMAEARKILDDYTPKLKQAIDDDDGQGVTEILDELSEPVQGFLIARLSAEQHDKLSILQEEQAA